MELKKLKTNPKCPGCKVPMKPESFNHYCDKKCCNQTPKTRYTTISLGHEVYQCPKCWDQYYEVE